MKRILIMVIFAVAVIGGINVFNAQESEPLSDIALANVEALAEGETTGMGSYDVLEDITNRYFKGELYHQNKIITCQTGGTKDCKAGKYYRYQRSDGSWSEWIPA